MNIVHSFGLKVIVIGAIVLTTIVSFAGCGESGGTYALGSQMPGVECFATLLPDGDGEIFVLLPGPAEKIEAWEITQPMTVPGGVIIGIAPEIAVTIDGHLRPVVCPPDFEDEATCLEILCPICRDPDGCPIQKRDD